jgi:hypothetical protein
MNRSKAILKTMKALKDAKTWANDVKRLAAQKRKKERRSHGSTATGDDANQTSEDGEEGDDDEEEDMDIADDAKGTTNLELVDASEAKVLLDEVHKDMEHAEADDDEEEEVTDEEEDLLASPQRMKPATEVSNIKDEVQRRTAPPTLSMSAAAAAGRQEEDGDGNSHKQLILPQHLSQEKDGRHVEEAGLRPAEEASSPPPPPSQPISLDNDPDASDTVSRNLCQ